MAAATPGMVVRRGMLFFYGERSRAASLEYYPPSRKGALIPDYETLMLPLLQLLEGGETRSIAECRSKLAGHFDLTSEELTQFIPSGRTLLFSGRVHWAKTYLGKAGAVESPARGQVRITDRGRELLALRLDRVTTALLTERYEEMREWRRASRAPNQTGPVATDVEGVGGLSPDEALEASYRRIREATESDLLERARAPRPRNSLSNWWSTFSLHWTTGVRLVPAFASGGAAMGAWMELFSRTSLVLNESTCRQSDGRRASDHQWFESSRAPYGSGEPRKGSSSRLRRSRMSP
ncbi:MAG: hypothetical protein FIB00_16390 [Chloroflexi bacterium]|nr:hypothetical protein [Chloroflexota bacterium]